MSSPLTSNSPHLKVMCAPYLLYTHRKEFQRLFAEMQSRHWQPSILLPFTALDTLNSMRDEALAIPALRAVHDPTNRMLLAVRGQRASRVARAIALLLYFVRVSALLVVQRPDLLLLTSDLGGVSVRFVQLVARRLGIPIVTLQTTLFLRVAEREDLKFEFKPRWLQRLLSRGTLQSLFLFFGDVPGTFLRESHIAVQNEEIGGVCQDFGKPADRIGVFGSLQASHIAEQRLAHLREPTSHPGGTRTRVLFLTECVEERFGTAMADLHGRWIKGLAEQARGHCDITVRFHPRESDRYRDALAVALDGLVTIDRHPDPAIATARSDIVIGAFSMLLFDAQSAGISSLFLDVGCDPIGFYNDRRVPIVSSESELISHVKRLAGSPHGIPSVPPDESAWAVQLLDWMVGLARR